MHLSSRLEEQQAESAFLTNYLQSKYAEHRQQHSKMTTETSNANITMEDMLLATEAMLVHKKEKEFMQRQKIKQLEEDFERRRSEKRRSLQQRLQLSEKIKGKGINRIQERLRKISERRSKVEASIRHNQLEEMSKNMELRKSFQLLDNRVKSNCSKSSRTNTVKMKQLRLDGGDIEYKLQRWKERQQRAKDYCQEYQKQKVQRAKSHNSIEVPEVKKRACWVKDNQVQIKSQEAMARIEQLNIVRSNKQRLFGQWQQRKKKAVSEKSRRIQRNLFQIAQKSQARCAELDEKYEKSVSKNPWKDPRGASRSKRIAENLFAIEKAEQKIEGVIAKHKEIAQRTRVYRQRREALYAAYQNMTIS